MGVIKILNPQSPIVPVVRMKAMIVDGSGHEGGHCDAVCRVMRSILSESGWESSLIRMGDGSGSHCRGCASCRDSGRCVFDDSISDVLGGMADTDLLVFVSPVRFSGPSSQTKLLMDRMNPLWYDHEGAPKRICAVLVGGSDDPKFSNAESEIRALALGIGSEWIGCLGISGTDRRDIEDTSSEAMPFIRDVIARSSSFRGSRK